MSKSRLIILSDIFGNTPENWMIDYKNTLNSHFQIIEYDCRVLAEISSTDPDAVHAEFVTGGIERAVENLLKIESESSEMTILGFSIGGTIGWKFACQHKCRQLFLVSATRLRNEEVKPTTQITLFYGEFEANGPSKDWFERFKLVPVIFEKEAHEYYKTQNFVKSICSTILENSL